jgi:hypothetical protein
MPERQREYEHDRACDDLAGPFQGIRGCKSHSAEASGSGPSGRDAARLEVIRKDDQRIAL